MRRVEFTGRERRGLRDEAIEIHGEVVDRLGDDDDLVRAAGLQRRTIEPAFRDGASTHFDLLQRPHHRTDGRDSERQRQQDERQRSKGHEL